MSPVPAGPLVTEPLLIHWSGAAPVVPVVLAEPVQDPAPPPGKGPEYGEASPIALVVIVVLAIVTIFLIRSMTKRLRRLPSSFGTGAGESGKAGDETGETADHQAAGAERGAEDARRRPEDAGGGRG